MALKKKVEEPKKKYAPASQLKASVPAVKEKAEVPSTEAIDFSADSGKGMEGADKSAFAIPFLIMLQTNSPQLETVPDAKAGLLMNTITNELYEEIKVVPCSYQRKFIRWAPRSQGGGFKGMYQPEEVETGKLEGCLLHEGTYYMDVPKGASPVDKEGKPAYDHLADTRGHFVLAQNGEGGWMPALLSLGSTQIKKSKRWMSLISGIEMKDSQGRAFNPPSFSHTYLVTAEKEENAKGSWWGVNITLDGPVVDPQLYRAAKQFYESVREGKVEATPPPSGEEEGQSTTSGKF